VSPGRITARRRSHKPLKVKKTCHPLTQALWHAMNGRQMTCHEMAQRSGIAEDTLYSWRRGRAPTVANLEACLNVVGLLLTVIGVDEAAE
jgi:hypothetical protein